MMSDLVSMRSLCAVLAMALAVTGCGRGTDGFDADVFRRNEPPGWCALPIPFPLSMQCDPPRSGMWDAVREALTPGMTREEVLDLLGAQDSERGGTLYYDMGSGWGIDTDYLTLYFDEEDRLVEVALTRS